MLEEGDGCRVLAQRPQGIGLGAMAHDAPSSPQRSEWHRDGRMTPGRHGEHLEPIGSRDVSDLVAFEESVQRHHRRRPLREDLLEQEKRLVGAVPAVTVVPDAHRRQSLLQLPGKALVIGDGESLGEGTPDDRDGSSAGTRFRTGGATSVALETHAHSPAQGREGREPVFAFLVLPAQHRIRLIDHRLRRVDE